MSKAKDLTLLTLILLTLANTNYADIGALDIVLFACMGAAVAATIALYVVQRRTPR